jgi:pyrroline-5-carboxylate reductase
MVMLDAAVRHGAVKPEEVLLYDINPERMADAAGRGFHAAGDERDAAGNCQYLFLAVLPQNSETVLGRLSECGLPERPVVISIVSGLGSSCIRRFLGGETQVVNIVPNLTLSVGFGATAVSRTGNVPDAVFDGIVKLLERSGQVAAVGEERLRDIIPANGCAPGYAFYMIDAVAEACAERGIDYGLAVRMAAASFAGAAKMLLDSDRTPKELLSQVCSPGGLTAKGVEYFTGRGLGEIIAGGIAESVKRGYELALD